VSRSRSAAKNTLKEIETLRGIKKGHLTNNQTGILNEIAFVETLFDDAAQPHPERWKYGRTRKLQQNPQ
jgi:hypothetical protein